MADFRLVITQGATLKPWTDPPSQGGKPSRIGALPGRDQRSWRGKRGVPITIMAEQYGGGAGPPDVVIGPFYPFLAEGFGPPLFVSGASSGFSSIVTWTPTNAGHHVIGFRRDGGGAAMVHIDVEP